MSTTSGFVYEWLESVWRCGILRYRTLRGYINFDRVKVGGALLDVPGLQASGGTITFADSVFTYALISLWNAHLNRWL